MATKRRKCAHYVDLSTGVKRRIKRACGGRPPEWSGRPMLGPYDTVADAKRGLERYRTHLERKYRGQCSRGKRR